MTEERKKERRGKKSWRVEEREETATNEKISVIAYLRGGETGRVLLTTVEGEKQFQKKE